MTIVNETNNNHEPVFLLKSKVLLIVTKCGRLTELSVKIIFEHHDLTDSKSKDYCSDKDAQTST